jgi:protein-S-isoprenylcysteine O-methyltransferase Ste14
MKSADFLAFITIMVWPAVPLFWIPVHGFPRFFRKLDVLTYVVPLVLWLPLGYFSVIYRDVLLSFRIDLPLVVKIAGLLFFGAGTFLHMWTGELLGIKGLIGLPEISWRVKSRLVMKGPFSVVRHPTYLAHTLLFAGVFLITGVVTVGVVTLLDFVMMNAVVIPLEERELGSRFGEEYKEYKERVPQFFPQIFRKKRE